MTEGIAIVFQKEGYIALALGQRVQGFKAVIQNAMVNLLTDAGTDLIYADRGTTLFFRALNAGIFNYRSASHACNFAASDTLFFSREHEEADADDKLNTVGLEPALLNFNRLDATVGFVSIDGRSASFQLTP
jgi:hypothetical protein